MSTLGQLPSSPSLHPKVCIRVYLDTLYPNRQRHSLSVEAEEAHQTGRLEGNATCARPLLPDVTAWNLAYGKQRRKRGESLPEGTFTNGGRFHYTQPRVQNFHTSSGDHEAAGRGLQGEGQEARTIR